MKTDKKSQQPDRRANRTILGRTLFLMILLGVVAFVPLLGKLYEIQIANHDYYESRAIDQQTDDLTVSANRGYIYDSQGNTLAMSATVYNVILSPADLKTVQAKYAELVEKGKKPDYPEPTNEFVAENLARILDLDKDKILTRLAKTNSRYEVLKWRVEKEESDAVNAFIVENHLSNSIVLPPTTKRYYPYGSLAAQVIGWVNPNDDNKGAYGLEALYEGELAGQTGRVVTAKDGSGKQMLYRFEDYYDATDGNNLTITLDATIQSFCERVLEEGIAAFDVQNGGFAIAMDPKTGAILAWANSPTYDLNQPWTVADPQLLAALAGITDDPSTEENEVQAAETNALYSQWRNKAITDTYEPGSTFKSVVLAAALEEGVVNDNTSFTCTGVVNVGGWDIKCSKRAPGHGVQNLAKAVANSCNPAFISIGQKLGAEKFYDYLEDFGFLQKTGIDMQGEMDTSSLIWPRDEFTSPNGLTSLATASFGQRFQVTPIQMITAASAVINGGHLMQPYVLESITDPDGNMIRHTEPTEVRQVISEETSEHCRTILEGVVKDGTGHKAYVAGYRIGGKTGSSQTLDKNRTIVSFLGFAPADDPQVVILLAYDNPKPVSPGSNYTSGGWYISGGNMAAKMAGELLGDIMDYMGVEKQYTAEELMAADTLVPSLVGMGLSDATAALQKANLDVRTVGDGETVTAQIPAQGASIPGGSKVVLYMGEQPSTELVEVPDLTGKTPAQAKSALSELGLYMKLSGDTDADSKAVTQTVAAGTQVPAGTVVEVSFLQNATGGGTSTGL